MILALFLLCPPPDPTSEVVARLGSPCFACREAASARLLALCRSPAGRDAALRGLDDRDPEVAMRCAVALRRSSPCGACEGRGWYGHGDSRGPVISVCEACAGTGMREGGR